MRKLKLKEKRTYSSVNGVRKFDWNKFLNKNNYTRDELYNATNKSFSWVTCACGNQCAVIPRNEYGEPLDDKLHHLGRRFYVYIKKMSWAFNRNSNNDLKEYQKEAKKVLKDIEERSAYLINEILKG